MNMTHEKLKILSALMHGPKSHKMLRLAYYGPDRAENPANTSFYNQLKRMMEAGLITKTTIGIYSITDRGTHYAKKYFTQEG